MIDGLGRIPVTLLVVPDYHRRGRIDRDPPFLRAVEQRLAKGDEVALHGYYHLDDQATPLGPTAWLRRRFYTAGEGEFAALSSAEAAARRERGLKLLQGLGWPVHGFVAPAWLLSAGSRAALPELPFAYTTTWRAIHRLPDWQTCVSPSLVYSVRSPVRRALSRSWNDWLFTRLRQRPAPLRLGLHPADARYHSVVHHWQHLIEQALPHRHPMTKYGWLEASACAAPVFG
jgi:predicted deacetylase